MPANPLYRHCIRRAADLLGGFDNLGTHIDVNPRLLKLWADGVGAPADAIFLKIIDIVLDKSQGVPRSAAPQAQGKPTL